MTFRRTNFAYNGSESVQAASGGAGTQIRRKMFYVNGKETPDGLEMVEVAEKYADEFGYEQNLIPGVYLTFGSKADRFQKHCRTYCRIHGAAKRSWIRHQPVQLVVYDPNQIFCYSRCFGWHGVDRWAKQFRNLYSKRKLLRYQQMWSTTLLYGLASSEQFLASTRWFCAWAGGTLNKFPSTIGGSYFWTGIFTFFAKVSTLRATLLAP